MSDLVGGSPSGSPRIPHGDQSLTRRLSTGGRENLDGLLRLDPDPRPTPSPVGQGHERSTSSADAGLIRGPLDQMFSRSPEVAQFSPIQSSRGQWALENAPGADETVYGEGRSSLTSHPMSREASASTHGYPDDSDKAFLTSNQMEHGYDRVGRPLYGAKSDRIGSSDQLEEGFHRHAHRSSADIYDVGFHQEPALQRARSGLHRVSKSIRRISKRVVNLDDRQRHARLPDAEIDIDDQDSDSSDPSAQPHADSGPKTAMSDSTIDSGPQTLRGKSLGMWGPDSRLRKSLARILSNWWIEPLILILILANTIVLVVQSARSVYKYPRKPGFFDYYDDYILISIFTIYTLEMFARIVVSGLVINPPPMYLEPDLQSQNLAEHFSSPEDFDPKERRRRMSKSNTLDTFAVLGDSLKSKASKALRPNEANLRPAAPSDLSTSLPPGRGAGFALSDYTGSLSAENMTKAGSGSSSGPDLDLRSRAPIRSNTALMLPKSDPSAFMQGKKAPFADAIVAQRAQAIHHAYLRHSWNRVDALAIVSFWVMVVLAVFRQESTESHHIYIFRALSVLRCARLLTATSGTTTILQSLKIAAPLLVNVTFFTAFAMILFSIIGIQSFKGSYRRSCVWVGDLNGQPGTNVTLDQICGGFIDQGQNRLGHIKSNGQPSEASPKGYLCPLGQICVESLTNPENNAQSFDNIFTSLLQVVIVISSNSWSDTMYNMIDADYYASCLYFIVGIIIMNFWLANLFVAVITNSFATITAQTKQSAFAAQKIVLSGTNPIHNNAVSRRRKKVANVYKRFWGYTKYLWLLAILADVGTQASVASYQTPQEKHRRDMAELYFTLAFDFEIVMRFLSFVLDGDWRSFLKSRQNVGDLLLAVITSIIQIPVIKDSRAYPWLTAFQLARFYRVIAAVPRMKALLVRVFGSMTGLLNMVLFLLMMVGLASLIAAQLFRGDIPAEEDGEEVEMTFKHIFNSFLAMYQIFSSENWTDVLWSAISNEVQFKQAVIAGIFIGGWFMFANFIVLQMFIAVINENFSVAEGEKRKQQLEHYLRRNEPPPQSGTARLLNKLSPYRYLRDRNAAKSGASGPASSEQHGGSDDRKRASNPIVGRGQVGGGEDEKLRRMSLNQLVNPSRAHRTVDTLKKFLRLDKPEEPVPLDTLRARQFRQSLSGEEMFKHQSFGVSDVYDADSNDKAARLFASERQLARMRSDLGLPGDDELEHARFQSDYANRGANDPRIQQARFIASHPSYDKSYFLFSNHSRFRRFCQSLVPPSHGERLFGRPVSPIRHNIFQIVIFLGIAGSVIAAGIATPAYRREYYDKYGLIRASWFSVLELSLSSLFLAEFMVKTIADGVAFTPNAYVLSIWNSLDLFVLITLLINVATELAVIGGVSRLTRALKAFRALRLINLSALMRETFHAVMIAGAGRILDASILSILYIIPYAIWGQNLFAGLLYSCNDGSEGIARKSDCHGEYLSSPSEWNFLAPRVWANPTEGSVYSFDDFKSSLLILFEIISLEGWIDVMTAAMGIAGKDQQPRNDAGQVNALFFLFYNLVGSTTVLTLFVSVIIENFQTFSGAAYQTTEQRSWLDLKRLIMRQRPSRRPKEKPTDRFRAWCYERAIQKHGWWSRCMTLLYACNVIVLMTQRYNDPESVEQIRDIIYLCFAIIYGCDIFIRLFGLGWKSFRENPWNLYDLAVVTGTVATTIPLLKGNPGNLTNVQFQKIFLTCVAFKLVQKSNALNQLFKTAIASLPAILSLFLLWITMFLVWGIMLVEVFGLTRWGANETYSKNFSTLIGSLVFLSMMSTGEGWNSYMHDYTVSAPECTPSHNYLMSDCGSEGWAFFLFITWNVISMYIFLNMFTGTVVENFSYVFQIGGKTTLSREEMRAYKEVWAEFDRERLGYIRRDQLVPFFRKLSGVFEMSLYPQQAQIKTLVDACDPGKTSAIPSSPSKSSNRAFQRLRAVSPGRSPVKESESSDASKSVWPPSPSRHVVHGIDVAALNRALGKLEAKELQYRRERFNRIFHECLLHQEKGKGIAFKRMLLILAHYKLINPTESLDLEELLERRALMEKVDDQVNLERVRGMLRMVYLRRRFLALREEAQMRQASAPQVSGDVSVPTILIEGADARERPELPRLDLSKIGAPDAARSFQQGSGLSPSPSQPSILEDFGSRISPSLEHFESTAWGDLMKRISRSD
ncbi:hypothetical protein IE53DRAFT_331270, partial [Violaceomyces palustris]